MFLEISPNSLKFHLVLTQLTCFFCIFFYCLQWSLFKTFPHSCKLVLLEQIHEVRKVPSIYDNASCMNWIIIYIIQNHVKNDIDIVMASE